MSKCDMAEIRFTYIRCKAIDASLINIPLCITKPISRNVTETSLHVRLARPVTNIVTRVRFMKKSSDYSLYFGENSYDACKFLDNRKIYPIADYLFNIIDDYTNLNHSCPYKGDIIIDRFRIRKDKLTWLPMPEGEYALFTSWNIDGKLRAELNFYFSYK
ncbi:PREDICTED: uncharacterized protein LOC108361217 [Rhagoletis zephyria]|uniref:uncharacterized protein LOC108361217 n=1 Tax=Rhagoletis zephyria TaxID=28612 RepID=UPI0008113B3E|nr:PREDICTED: uncharacterized protein LOC108361217 [Rhagoletis zephyria]